MTRLTATFTFALWLLGHGLASAQEAPATEPQLPPPAEPPAALEPAPAAPSVEAETSFSAPAPEQVPVEMAPAAAEAAPAEEGSWSDDLSLGMFVDSYYNFDWNLPSEMGANGTPAHTAFVNNQGFALSFVGVDATYEGDRVGATLSLRYGPSSVRLIGANAPGLDVIWQGYLTLEPTDSLTLDMGQFATLYGAEVSESWKNINYTRGALYFAYQPFWHTGLRASYAASDTVTVNALVVNGVNQAWDLDRSVDFGLQLAVAPMDELFFAIGWYGSPIESDGKYWSNFVDLVVTASSGPASLVFNADLGFNDVGADTFTYYGLSLAGRYGFTDAFAMGLRGEYLGNPDAVSASFGESLITGTLTFEYIPFESDNVVLRLDGRVEKADIDTFFDKDAAVDAMGTLVANKDTYISTVLGVVVKTN